MKTRTLIAILILVLAVSIVIISCVTLLTPPLHLQAEKGNLLRVKKLIEAGADVNAKNNEGRTALKWASKKWHTDIVKLLKEAGTK